MTNKTLQIMIFSSIFLALLGLAAYLIEESFYYYLCKDKIFSSAFSDCSDPYKRLASILKFAFLSGSFLLSFFIIFQDRVKMRFYIKTLVILVSLATFLVIISWDDSNGSWLSINSGEIVLAFFLLSFPALISSVAWSYLFKSRVLFGIIFFILILYSLFNIDSLTSYIKQRLTGNTIGGSLLRHECNKIILDRAKDKCIQSKAIEDYNTDLCEEIHNSSFKIDCLNYIYRNRGSMKGDTSWCELISDPYQKQLCYN